MFMITAYLFQPGYAFFLGFLFSRTLEMSILLSWWLGDSNLVFHYSVMSLFPLLNARTAVAEKLIQDSLSFTVQLIF